MFPHQQCREFCRIESHGKNNGTSLIKSTINFIFSTYSAYLYSIEFISSFWVFFFFGN